ncbi:MAG: choice-of-anchor D domain-containing protein [Candidatus Acidiferrales bacterium]
MRRFLVLCAVTVAILAAFAVSRRERAALAASTGSFRVIAPDPPGCPLGPASTFCSRFPGTSSDPLTFTVLIGTAVSNPTLAVAAVPGLAANFAAGDFSITNNTCTGSLTAGSSCTFDVIFSPTTTGLREAAVTFNGAHLVNFAGTGATFVLVRPTSAPTCSQPNPADNAFTYCQEAVGAPSATQTFTVMTANAVTGLNIALAAVPGLTSEFNAADFTIQSTTCTGTLAANASCTVNVAFTPTTAGLRSAVLTATDAANDTATIYLAGHTNTGLLFTLPITATCSYGSFDFCNEPSGGTTASNVYTLTNTSGTQLTGVSVPKASVNGNFTVTGTSCVATLAANGTCTINVAFTPQGTGLLQDTLSVTDSAGDIGAANFAGTGDDFELQLASSQTTEVSITQGGTATFMAQVVPDAVFGQNGEQVTFVCPTNLPDNTSCTISPCPAKMTPGTPTAVQITFVTSSTTVLAPRPAPDTPCTSYGPPVVASVVGPLMHGPRAPSAPTAPPGQRFPALSVLAIFGAIALLSGGLAAMIGNVGARKRVPLVFAVAGIAAVIFVGCHHSSVTTQATPLGSYTMTFQANALDSSGNPLNASRTLPQAQVFTLDVTTATTNPF